MNRRKFLAGSGIGIASIAGCYGLGQTLSTEDTAAPSADGSNQTGENPDISADQANSTDTPPQEREETSPETEDATQSESNETVQDSEPAESVEQGPPDKDPTQAIEIPEHQMIFEEAAGPQYGSDELFLQGVIRSTSTHPLQNIRLDGYAYAGDTEVGHEFLEYASLEGRGERQFELPFFVENPSEVDWYELAVTAAQWA